MKSLIFLLTSGILILGISTVSVAQNTSEKETKVSTTEQIKLEIEGMVCSYCEKNAKKSLRELEGVKVESISASEGVARLTYTGTEPISDESLRKAVENVGYKLKKIERDSDDGANR